MNSGIFHYISKSCYIQDRAWMFLGKRNKETTKIRKKNINFGAFCLQWHLKSFTSMLKSNFVYTSLPDISMFYSFYKIKNLSLEL